MYLHLITWSTDVYWSPGVSFCFIPRNDWNCSNIFVCVLIYCLPTSTHNARGWGWGFISQIVVTFNHVDGFPNLCKCHHQVCLNNRIFCSNSGLCSLCYAHFMCYLEFWPTSVSHPFFFINGCFVRKLQELSLDMFFKMLLFQVTFFAFCALLLFLRTFFWLVGWLLQYVALSQPGISDRFIINWWRAAVSHDKSECLHFFVFLFFINFVFLFYQVNCNLYSVLHMWGKITIQLYRLWLHGLYELHEPDGRCPKKTR